MTRIFRCRGIRGEWAVVCWAVLMGCMTVWCGAADVEPSERFVLRFANGDSLHGNVGSIDAQKLVQFTSPAIKEVMKFNVEELASIRIHRREGTVPRLEERYLLQFIDGDQLRGNISVVDAEKVIFDTWYAGQLTIPRHRVRSIRLLQTERILYEGPAGLEGWVVSDSVAEENDGDSWKYKDGVFYGNEGGGIAREMNLPDMASIDLDVAWRDFLQLTITVYTESLEVYQLGQNLRQANGALINVAAPAQPGAGFYAIQINRNTVYLLTLKKDGQQINTPLEVLRQFDSKNSARIGVRVNKVQKSISLLVDGQLVKTWQENDEFAGAGTAVRLVQQGATLVNVSNIRVAEWDGRLDAPVISSAKVTTDLVHLRNQDTLSGKLEGVNEGRVSFTTSFGTLDIPVERVAQIELPAAEVAPQEVPGTVRARPVGGRGTLTFQLEAWTDQRIVATSPNFGKASFEPGAFEHIDFSVRRR